MRVHRSNQELQDALEGYKQLVELYSIISLQSIGGYGCFIYLDGVKTLNQSNGKLPLHITLYTGYESGREVSPAEFGPILKDSLHDLPLSVNDYSPLTKLYEEGILTKEELKRKSDELISQI